MPSLLQKALASKQKRARNHPVTDEHIELMVAVLRSQVDQMQACEALGLSSRHASSFAHWFAKALQAAYDRGILVVAEDRLPAVSITKDPPAISKPPSAKRGPGRPKGAKSKPSRKLYIDMASPGTCPNHGRDLVNEFGFWTCPDCVDEEV